LDGTFKVLLSYGRAGNGQIMLDVAHQMFSRGNKKLDLTALHLTVGADINPLHTDNFKAISFEPILYGAKKLGFQIQTRYEISNNAGEDICNIVNNEGYDFLLVGSGISYSNSPEDIEANRYRTSFYNRFFRRFKAPESWFYPGDLLKDKTKTFIARSHCDVGVFINRNFIKATSIIVIFSNEEELFLLDYVKTLLKSTHGSVSILNRAATTVAGYTHITNTIREFISSIPRASLLPNKDLTAELFYGFNFMLIGYNTWNDVSEHDKEALQKMPSTLILNKYQKSSNPSTEEIK
jgi:hypothetical protein